MWHVKGSVLLPFVRAECLPDLYTSGRDKLSKPTACDTHCCTYPARYTPLPFTYPWCTAAGNHSRPSRCRPAHTVCASRLVSLGPGVDLCADLPTVQLMSIGLQPDPA